MIITKIKERKIHEHGFVRLIDVMGDDNSIADGARVSYGKGTRAVSDNRNLIRYLVRHKHTSPLEMVEVKFHLKLPIFVMRQFMRHRTASLNEYSGRYSIMSDHCYEPSEEYIQPQSKFNNQGRDGDMPDTWKSRYRQTINEITHKCLVAYKNLIGTGSVSHGGLARELARIVLPVSNYTECYWKMDLHNFFHFCQLRMDDHAQQEIQDYAEAMYHLVFPHFPLCCEAFEHYVRNAVTFSEQEMDVIKELLEYADTKAALAGISQCMADYEGFHLGKRETKEFLEKLSLIFQNSRA